MATLLLSYLYTCQILQPQNYIIHPGISELVLLVYESIFSECELYMSELDREVLTWHPHIAHQNILTISTLSSPVFRSSHSTIGGSGRRCYCVRTSQLLLCQEEERGAEIYCRQLFRYYPPARAFIGNWKEGAYAHHIIMLSSGQ